MRSYDIDIAPVSICVNGQKFDLIKTDAVAQAEILQFVASGATLKIDKPADVEKYLQNGCELLDSCLGSGACYSIFGAAPISLGKLLALLMQIGADCAKAYRQYIKEEYMDD